MIPRMTQKYKQKHYPYLPKNVCRLTNKKPNPFLMKQKLDSNVQYFAGIDLHKKFMQVAFLDAEGTVCYERRIECDHDIVRQTFQFFPKDVKYVMESSSVWYAMYRLLSDELKLDVILSNPYKTRIIAEIQEKDRQSLMPAYWQTWLRGKLHCTVLCT